MSSLEFISADFRYLQTRFSHPDCFYVQWRATGNSQVQLFYLFYTTALGGDEIRESSMYFSALVIKGAESDKLMCEHLL